MPETNTLISRSSVWAGEITAPALSPDGRYVSFIRSQDSIPCLWVKQAFEPSPILPLTGRTPVREYRWMPDSRSILYLVDEEDGRTCNLWIIDVVPDSSQRGLVPQKLTDLEGATVRIYCIPDTPENTAFVGINDRDPAWHDLYEITLVPCSQRLVHANKDRIGAWYFDLHGRLRIVQRTMPMRTGQEFVLWDGPAPQSVLQFHAAEFCRLVGFHQDGRRAFVESNINAEFIQLILLDCSTGQREIIDTDPLGKNYLASVVFSNIEGRVMLTVYEGERQRRQFFDVGYQKDFERLQDSFPDSEIEIVSRSRNLLKNAIPA